MKKYNLCIENNTAYPITKTLKVCESRKKRPTSVLTAHCSTTPEEFCAVNKGRHRKENKKNMKIFRCQKVPSRQRCQCFGQVSSSDSESEAEFYCKPRRRMTSSKPKMSDKETGDSDDEDMYCSAPTSESYESDSSQQDDDCMYIVPKSLFDKFQKSMKKQNCGKKKKRTYKLIKCWTFDHIDCFFLFMSIVRIDNQFPKNIHHWNFYLSAEPKA